MQVTETLNEGLKRKLSLVIPASDLSQRLDARLEELKSTANIKGFRPGKVPMAHLKKVYGRSAMSEVLSDAINANVSQVLDDRSERAATQPSLQGRRETDGEGAASDEAQINGGPQPRTDPGTGGRAGSIYHWHGAVSFRDARSVATRAMGTK